MSLTILKFGGMLKGWAAARPRMVVSVLIIYNITMACVIMANKHTIFARVMNTQRLREWR